MNKKMIIAQAKADKKRGLELDPLNPDDLENVMMEYGYDDEELAIYKDAYFGSKVEEAKGNKASIGNKELNTSIKDFYTQAYPTDELGLEINDGTTFKDLLVAIKDGKDYEDVLGFSDSTVRERLFDKLANILGVSYEKIYYLWLDQDSSFLNKASVEEAFSYEDEEFFTREEVDDFAEKVCEHINETFNEVFKVQESYITSNEIEVVVYNDELGEFTGKKKVDMRRIRKPSDLDKYVLDIAADIIEEIKEVLIDSDYRDADEDELRKMGVFDEALTEGEDNDWLKAEKEFADAEEEFLDAWEESYQETVKAEGKEEADGIQQEYLNYKTSNPNIKASIEEWADDFGLTFDEAYSLIKEFNKKLNKESLTEDSETINSDFIIKDGVLIDYRRAYEHVTIPDNVTSIGYQAFKNCESLTSIVIPDSVTSIGKYAFEDCTNLTSVTIGNSVTRIGECAFGGCTSLTSIEIPNSVEIIDGWAFSYCGSLKSITIGNGVTSIGEEAFSNCESLTNVTIGDSVETIGKHAFAFCTSLTNITIPDNVTDIKEAAFLQCTSLTSIVIPNSVTSIGSAVFMSCTSLKSVVIPDSVDHIGFSAFSGCSALTNIIIPNSVTEISNQAFKHCSSLTSIEIPNSVTSIGNSAFNGCTSLTIYCETESKPSGWLSGWNGNCSVVWGYKKSALTEDSDNDDVVEGRYTLSLERIPSTGNNLSSWKVAVEADSEEDALKDFKAFAGEDSGIKVSNINPTTKAELEDKSIRVINKHPMHEDSDDNGPYSYKETEAELQSLTQNWTREKDQLKCGYDEEKNYGMEILSKHGYECKADRQGGWWIVDYWKDLDSDRKGVRFGKAKKAVDFDPMTYDEDVFKPGLIVEFAEDVMYGDAEIVAEAELDKYPITAAEAEEFITKHGFKMSTEDEGMFYIPRGTRAKFIGQFNAGPSWPMFEINGVELEFAGDEPFKVIIIDDSITEAATITKGWYGSRYTDYNKEDGWTDEDIAKHKEIDWKERNYSDCPIPEDSFTGEAVAHTDNGTKRVKVKFVKFIRSNPIFPPYYAPEKKPFTGVVGPMYDGNKRGSYGIHDRYESQDVYDALSR